MARRKKAQPLYQKPQFYCLIIIILASLSIGAALFISKNFNPKVLVERELEKIAKDYYETYFYPNFLQNGKRIEVIKKYEKSGTPAVYLRQLLHFDNDRYVSSAPIFQQNNYTCDTNKTSVQFYPTAPFGPTDYEIKYDYQCK